MALTARPAEVNRGELRRAGGEVFGGLLYDWSWLTLDGTLGLDIEALWGEVADRPDEPFRSFGLAGVGLAGSVGLGLRLWRGLSVATHIGAILRPKRTLVTLRGTQVASLGFVEGIVSVTIGWVFR